MYIADEVGGRVCHLDGKQIFVSTSWHNTIASRGNKFREVGALFLFKIKYDFIKHIKRT